MKKETIIKNGLKKEINISGKGVDVEYEQSDYDPLVMSFSVFYYGVKIADIITAEDAKTYEEMVSVREAHDILAKIQVLDEARERWKGKL